MLSYDQLRLHTRVPYQYLYSYLCNIAKFLCYCDVFVVVWLVVDVYPDQGGSSTTQNPENISEDPPNVGTGLFFTY